MSETDEIAWLRTVLEQATPGPWESREWEDLAAIVGKGGRGWVLEGDVVPAGQDARAVAALGTLWPFLVSLAEAVDTAPRERDVHEAKVRALRDAIRAHRERVDAGE